VYAKRPPARNSGDHRTAKRLRCRDRKRIRLVVSGRSYHLVDGLLI
jgi:hypothetical protein